ncbi:MAG: phenylalanine--tRNA ligase subunit beta [Thermaceae bacterium]
MRVPLSWLKAYLPEVPPSERLEELLAQLGFEVEAIEEKPAPPKGVVFARVMEASPIPGTGLHRLVLDIGRAVEVVSGAPNAKEGIGVALALPGTELFGIRVEEKRIRGVVSHGMALSPKELGVGEYAAGLLEFPPEALPPGTPLAEAWPEEEVLVVEVTPNRPDALGIFGLARDLSALGMDLAFPEAEVQGADLPLPFRAEVEDERDAPHFTLSYARLKVGPSPLRLQRWLFSAGMRPINNVVDITNFVMLELSQPMHAFDRRWVGEGLRVRRARKGETLLTLDGVERKLSEEDLLITAIHGKESLPIGLAGIMGGRESEVKEDTEEIALEVACFNPVRIRKTSRRLGLRTEASHRFERGVDPLGQPFAQRRAQHLLEKLAHAQVARRILDLGNPKEPDPIPFRPGYANRLLGTDYPEEVQLSILKRLFCKVEGSGSPYQVIPPSFRVDLKLEEDLVEEVARIQGYETIPTTLPAFFPAPDNRNAEEAYRKKQALKTLLSGLGFQEAMPYPFTSEEEARFFGVPLPTLRILNPQAPERSAMRTLLFPGLVKLVETILKNQEADRVLLFEVGQVFQGVEKTHVAGLLLGQALGGGWSKEGMGGFYALKGLLEAAMDRLGLRVSVIPKGFPWLHPGVSGEVWVSGDGPVGFIGQVHPKTTQALGLPPLYVFELLWPFPEEGRPFRDPPRFPRASRDLAVVVPEEVSYAEVEGVLEASAGDLLEELEPFDVYQGPPLKEGEKSMAFHLHFRHPEKTLTDEEVGEIIGKMLDFIQKKGWRLRG